MGIFHYFPLLSLTRQIDYIRDYFIIMYFDFISSTFYKNNYSLVKQYYETLKLFYLCGAITSLNEGCFYIPFRTHSGVYKVPLIFTNDTNIRTAVDENGKDLSCFLGPSKNFFGIKLSPRDIGCKEVLVMFEDDTHKRFMENETIIF